MNMPDGAAGARFALSAEEFRRLGYRAIDLAAAHLADMRDRPVFRPMPPSDRRRLLDQLLPDEATAANAILERVRDDVLSYPMGNGHPCFFGWINSPPAPIGVIADVLAAALNASCAGGDHAAIYLERCAVRWLMELVSFPVDGSMGLLVSGGSMASLTCLAAARHRAALADGWNDRVAGLQQSDGRSPLVLYLSEEGHSCLRKAGEL